MRQQRQPDRYEQCARDRLEPMLGPLRCMDPGGGPEGAHDFEADLDDGGFAAIEVTGEVESGQRALESLVRRLPPLTVPGSRWRWQTGLAWVSADAARQGRVILSPGTYGGWEWGGAATDSWLAEFLASPRGINKVVKLRSVSKADQWHLVIVLDPRSQAGMGITLQESWAALPELQPPEPLTHLWLLPMPTDWPGLCWACGSGWSVLTASGDASAA